ncbi:MAG: pyruvate kinase [Gammaproteobacteria bacterium]|nr:pyruvate kinase [Gammaproteobacteria bacterium]
MSSSTPLRKTKIVATIGPACDSVETLQKMIAGGLSVVRINLSHGNFNEHGQRVQRIRDAAQVAEAHVAIMVDTRGIEIRTGMLSQGPVQLMAGQHFFLSSNEHLGNESGVSISYSNLPTEVSAGTSILLDDAAIELMVTETGTDVIHCRIIHGGMLGERKSVNIPDIQLGISTLSSEYLHKLKAEVEFAVNHQVDYLAASFVQSGEEVEQIRTLLKAGGREIPIIAKIENRAGVNNLEDIIKAADGIMVARGDLGVELPLAEIPSTQKKLIRNTVTKGKPVITATQMLASMESNPRPTRAEASDVANAILDGTSAVMLSGETAVGKYPVQVIEVMAAIALRAEASLREYGFLQAIPPSAANKVAEAVGQAASRLAEQLQAAAIISLTDSGFTARLISRHRPESAIIAVTKDSWVARRLAMNWGVIPLLCPEEAIENDQTRTEFGCSKARELGYLDPGDTVVVTHGTQPGMGGTDLIRVITA